MFNLIRNFKIILQNSCTISPSSVWKLDLFHIFNNTCYYQSFFILFTLMSMKWHYIVFFICISLMAKDMEHLHNFIDHMYTFFGEMSIQMLSTFNNCYLCFYYWVIILYIFQVLLTHFIYKCSSHSMHYVSTFFMVSFELQKFSILMKSNLFIFFMWYLCFWFHM